MSTLEKLIEKESPESQKRIQELTEERKHEFDNTFSSNTTVLSREGAEHFSELLDNTDRIFGKKQDEFRALASKIDIKS